MYAYFFGLMEGGSMLRRLLFVACLVISPCMNVYSIASSLLDSDVIRQNIKNLRRLRLPTYTDDKVFIVLERQTINTMTIEVFVGRMSKTGDNINCNKNYERNAQACQLCSNIVQDLKRNIFMNDFRKKKVVYPIPFLVMSYTRYRAEFEDC